MNPEHERMVAALLAETRANGGLAPVDLERFWHDQKRAIEAPFSPSIPQVPLGAICSAECVYDELGVPEDHWRYQNDEAWRLQLNRVYNDKAEKIVGKRLLNEQPADPARQYPKFKLLHDIFEAKNVWHGNSWWLQEAATNEDELKALLDRVDARLANLKAFVLPPEWEAETARLKALGMPPQRYRAQRGPCTFATSLYGPERLLLLMYDNEALAVRLRDTILRAMLGLAQVLDDAAGYGPGEEPRGFYFLDDNCTLFSPPLYELFGYPILKAVFERFSTGPDDMRGQHSDSAMGHLLPLLGKLNLTTVNFGPTLTVREIREHCPRAVICGQLAPFTYSRNEEANMVREFLRDFDQARDKRGLVFATAGSVNNGSRLTGMRLLMAAIQRYGRYDA